ncbi:flavodoxin-dependent (E)-4-hydroxy-3-methylbut-2-enyl-diphosphate synthase [Escherichia coli]
MAANPIEEIKVSFRYFEIAAYPFTRNRLHRLPTCWRQEFDVIGTVNALEQRLEDIITPMDVSIIGCVVKWPGEALVSTLGVTGGDEKSGLYEDGVRKDRLDNNNMIDQLEARRFVESQSAGRSASIDVQRVEK